MLDYIHEHNKKVAFLEEKQYLQKLKPFEFRRRDVKQILTHQYNVKGPRVKPRDRFNSTSLSYIYEVGNPKKGNG